MKDRVVKAKVLGFPTAYSDKISKKALFDKTRNYNIDARTPLHPIDDSDDYNNALEMRFGFEVDFVERVYKFEYF